VRALKALVVVIALSSTVPRSVSTSFAADVPTCKGKAATIVGTSGDDFLTGPGTPTSWLVLAATT
jgi:hypothetical protein